MSALLMPCCCILRPQALIRRPFVLCVDILLLKADVLVHRTSRKAQRRRALPIFSLLGQGGEEDLGSRVSFLIDSFQREDANASFYFFDHR